MGPEGISGLPQPGSSSRRGSRQSFELLAHLQRRLHIIRGTRRTLKGPPPTSPLSVRHLRAVSAVPCPDADGGPAPLCSSVRRVRCLMLRCRWRCASSSSKAGTGRQQPQRSHVRSMPREKEIPEIRDEPKKKPHSRGGYGANRKQSSRTEDCCDLRCGKWGERSAGPDNIRTL
jgi:hypothetical protein